LNKWDQIEDFKDKSNPASDTISLNTFHMLSDALYGAYALPYFNCLQYLNLRFRSLDFLLLAFITTKEDRVEQVENRFAIATLEA
jgi:hypothetical protein